MQPSQISILLGLDSLNKGRLLLILYFRISVSVLHRSSSRKSILVLWSTTKFSVFIVQEKKWERGGNFLQCWFLGLSSIHSVSFLSENIDCNNCSAEENKYCAKENGIPTCKCKPNFEPKNGACVSWVLSFFLHSYVLGKARGEDHLKQGHPQSRRTACSYVNQRAA